ncbi:sigma-70 family RNA polymerase sigma factor [Streptomyces sp. CB03238]|uniref:RNA polymerase sigma factor n=1 Tax=Streptomyces sp. CB03238 TaxID=1907777 RepID=UPI000A121E14|nr:sigma-70 family RNA polymerase sigma factor [Streptomyces sp. CB03238]ORT58256.1 RNA polymerase subunit sigma [Streptomyces sp. CB03238]
MATDMHAPSDDDRWQRAWSHREQLLKVARRRSMTPEDAEDAVHEAMLRAAEQPHLDDERLGAWLTTVTMRLCVDRHRQVRREADPGRAAALVPPGPAPVDEVVCDRAEATWLARRSGELPARQAEALWLKSEDLDVGQVARKMGLSYRTVESLLARARRTLRNSLAATLGLVLWLCGRGRPRGVGNAHVVAAASTAATLAVAGFVAPYAHDWPQDRPASAPATSGTADVRPGDGAHPRVSPPAASATWEQPAPGLRGGAPSTGPSPLLTKPALPVLPPLPPLPGAEVPEVPPVPEVADVPEVPEVPALPGVSDVPEVAGVPEAPDVPEAPNVPEVPQVPDTPEAPQVPGAPQLPDTPEVPAP